MSFISQLFSDISNAISVKDFNSLQINDVKNARIKQSFENVVTKLKNNTSNEAKLKSIIELFLSIKTEASRAAKNNNTLLSKEQIKTVDKLIVKIEQLLDSCIGKIKYKTQREDKQNVERLYWAKKQLTETSEKLKSLSPKNVLAPTAAPLQNKRIQNQSALPIATATAVPLVAQAALQSVSTAKPQRAATSAPAHPTVAVEEDTPTQNFIDTLQRIDESSSFYKRSLLYEVVSDETPRTKAERLLGFCQEINDSLNKLHPTSAPDEVQGILNQSEKDIATHDSQRRAKALFSLQGRVDLKNMTKPDRALYVHNFLHAVREARGKGLEKYRTFFPQLKKTDPFTHTDAARMLHEMTQGKSVEELLPQVDQFFHLQKRAQLEEQLKKQYNSLNITDISRMTGLSAEQVKTAFDKGIQACLTLLSKKASTLQREEDGELDLDQFETAILAPFRELRIKVKPSDKEAIRTAILEILTPLKDEYSVHEEELAELDRNNLQLQQKVLEATATALTALRKKAEKLITKSTVCDQSLHTIDGLTALLRSIQEASIPKQKIDHVNSYLKKAGFTAIQNPNKPLGSGVTGVVHKVTKGGKEFVVKIFKEPILRSDWEAMHMSGERLALLVNHPNVLSIVPEVIYTADNHVQAVIMPFIEGHELQREMVRLMKEKLHKSPENAQPLLKAIASGLHALHEQGIIHLDVWPANIMILPKDPSIAKIIDFGFAQRLDSKTKTVAHPGLDKIGSIAMAPEAQDTNNPLTEKADAYCFGSLMYTMLEGKPPYARGKPIFQHIQNSALQEMISGLLERDPARRLSLGECLRHPYFQQS